MTIVSHSKEWNLPIYILASYIAIGFAIIFLLPDKFVSSSILHMDHGLFGRISAISRDNARTSFFCSWMTVLYPIVFLMFSAFAPVK
jgi:ABC-type Mn2+/Zn2+ transport system permease subunit